MKGKKRKATAGDLKKGLNKLCRGCPYRKLASKVLDAVLSARKKS